MKVKKITIIHSGGEPDYLFGLVSALSRFHDNQIDIIDSEKTKDLFASFSNVKHYNYKGDTSKGKNLFLILLKGLKYYFNLISYTLKTDSKIYHIQWLSRNAKSERLFLVPFIKFMGKKIIFTAHNINKDERDNTDSLFNRITLSFFYNIIDHIIVHTDQMKQILISIYKIPGEKISIIKHGLNVSAPRQGMKQTTARKILNIDEGRKVLLFFGNIAYYKGIDILIEACNQLWIEDDGYILLIAGKGKPDEGAYLKKVTASILSSNRNDRILARIQFIPENDIEKYFMAADCIILPYRKIFQSGILFLAFRFGLPALLSDVGNFKESVIIGETGYSFESENVLSLKMAIKEYFSSYIYKNLEQTREDIINFGERNYSWDKIAESTKSIYEKVVEK